MLSYWIKNFYSHLFPSSCSLCKAATHNEAICSPCREELPWLQSACQQCANVLKDDERASLQCGECLKKPPPYDNTLALFQYQPPVDNLILALKFSNKLEHAQLLGCLMAEVIMQHYTTQQRPELIIPIPLHNKRLRERGYNQALELARPLAKKMQIPLSLKDCFRVNETKPQAASIAAEDRRKNIKDAFVINFAVPVKHVAIVDDVITTGSTVSEFSASLRKAGVEKIDVWCCARTEMSKKS